MSDAFGFLERFDTEVRRSKAILASAYRTESLPNIRRSVGPFALAAHNWIDWYACGESDAGGLIDQQVSTYSELGHAFRWKVYGHDQPAAMPALLEKKGFTRADTSAVMVLDVAGNELVRPEGVEYRKVVDPDGLADELRAIRDTVWGDGADELIRALAMELRDIGNHMSIYVAKDGDATIGGGLVRYNEHSTFGGLFAGATVPDMRGRGVYRGTVAARVEDARIRGAGHLYTEAGPMSEPILKRLGFRQISSVSNFIWEPEKAGKGH